MSAWLWMPLLALVVADALLHAGEARRRGAVRGPGDQANHLALIQQIRQHGRVPPRGFSYSVLPARRRRYPFLYHWLLSSAPPGNEDRWGAILSLGFRSLFLALVGAVALVLAARTGVDGPAAGLAGALAAFGVAGSPIFLNFSKSTALQFDLSPRAFGRFWSGLACALLSWSLVDASATWALAGASAATAVVLLSSKFGAQAVAGTFVGLALLLGTWRPLLAILSGVALAVVASGGLYLEIAWGQLTHLRQYYLHIQRVHPLTTGDYAPRFRHLADVLLHPGRASLARVQADPFLRYLGFWFPQNVVLFGVAAAAMANHPWALLADPAGRVLAAWLGVNLALWAITMVPSLRFLGEPDRYIEFAGAPPLAALSAVAVVSALPEPWAVAALVLALGFPLAFLARTLQYRRARGPPAADEPWARELDALRALPDGVVLTVPVRVGHFLWVRLRRHRYVVDNVGDLRVPELFDRYPVMDRVLDGLLARYRVDYLVVPAKARFQEHHIDRHKLVAEGPEARIYRVQLE